MLTIGERLKKYRTSLGMSQKDFARRAAFSASYLCEIESGERSPGSPILIKLADAFKINLHWLITGTGGMTTANDKNSLCCNFNTIESDPELTELVEDLRQSPFLRLVVLTFTTKYKLTHEDIIQKDIQKNRDKASKLSINRKEDSREPTKKKDR